MAHMGQYSFERIWKRDIVSATIFTDLIKKCKSNMKFCPMEINEDLTYHIGKIQANKVQCNL